MKEKGKNQRTTYAHQMATAEYQRRLKMAEEAAAKYSSRRTASSEPEKKDKKPRPKAQGVFSKSTKPQSAKAIGPKKSFKQGFINGIKFQLGRIAVVLSIALIVCIIFAATRYAAQHKYDGMTLGEIEVAEGRMTKEEGEAYDEQLKAELTAKVQALQEEIKNGKPGALDPRIIYPQDEKKGLILTNNVEELRQAAIAANLEPPRMYFKQTDGVPADLEYQNKGFVPREIYPAVAEIDKVVFNSVRDREVYGDERYGAYVREVGEDDGTNFYVNLHPEDVPVTVHAGNFFDVAALILNDRTVPAEVYESAKSGAITSKEIAQQYGSTLAAVHITTPCFLARGEIADITVEIQPSPADDADANFEGIRSTVKIQAAEDMFIERAYQTVPTFGLLRESSTVNGHRMHNMLHGDNIEATIIDEPTQHGELKTCIKVGRVGPSIEMGQMAICTFLAEPARDSKVIKSFQDTVLMQYNKAPEAAENSENGTEEDDSTTTDSE